MARQKLRDYEMDEMEILYYMRQEARNKAYKAKQKKLSIRTKHLLRESGRKTILLSLRE